MNTEVREEYMEPTCDITHFSDVPVYELTQPQMEMSHAQTDIICDCQSPQ